MSSAPPRRHHARRVELLDRLAGAAALVEPEGDPLFQILDAVAADAEFYEVQGHGEWFSAGGGGVNASGDVCPQAAACAFVRRERLSTPRR